MDDEELTRDQRIEAYYQESAWTLAEALVDAQDAVAILTDEVKRLEAESG